MGDESVALLVEARTTRDFVRSLRALAERVSVPPELEGALDEQYPVVIDRDGIRPGLGALVDPPTLSLALPWDRIGRLRNDWIRRESPDALDVVGLLLGVGGHSEVNDTVLVVPVATDSVSPVE